MWRNAMDSNVLNLVKKLCSTAVDPDMLLLGTGPRSWNYHITISLALLADDIFMYQITGSAAVEPLNRWILRTFALIMNGRGISTRVDVEEELTLREIWRGFDMVH